MIELNIATLAGGDCIRRINSALQQAVANVLDLNTDAKAKRKVTVSIVLAPNEARNMASISCDVQFKPCPPTPVVTGATMGVSVETGELTAFELRGGSQELGAPLNGLAEHMSPGDTMTISDAGGQVTFTKTADGAVIPQAEAWKM